MTLLKDIVQIEKGRKYNLLEENQEGAIRVFQANDFRNENKPLYTLDTDGVLAQKDDIMLVWDGSVGQMGFGRSGYVGSTMVKLKVKNKKQYLPFFIYRFLQTKSEYLKRKATGATIMHINRKSLEQLEIPDLEIDDQLHIANLLGKAESLIAQRKESIRLLDEFLKSAFLEMFGECTKNEKNWNKIELKYFGEIITGNTPPRNNDENYSSNFIEWIKTDNIPVDDTYITKAVEYLSESGLRFARTVEAGALLVACIAGSIQSVGRAALTNRKVSFNQQINAIQPNEEIEPLYLYWLFKISRKYIQDAASNGMKKILTKGGFEKIKMIKPPIELQTQFAQIVEKTEAIKTQYQQSLQELENLYGSLSQKAFRGELCLKDDSLLMAAEPNIEYKTL
ncbi:restriction endonuclease subunit S [Draconibacterium sp.]